MKPSKACFACSTLFSAKDLISDGISNRSCAAMFILLLRQQCPISHVYMCAFLRAIRLPHVWNWSSCPSLRDRAQDESSYQIENDDANPRYPRMRYSGRFEHQQFEHRF